jgi:hypothetical protein
LQRFTCIWDKQVEDCQYRCDFCLVWIYEDKDLRIVQPKQLRSKWRAEKRQQILSCWKLRRRSRKHTERTPAGKKSALMMQGRPTFWLPLDGNLKGLIANLRSSFAVNPDIKDTPLTCRMATAVWSINEKKAPPRRQQLNMLRIQHVPTVPVSRTRTQLQKYSSNLWTSN